MQNGLYVAVSAQVASQRRLETIADNIANMNTVGYRATGVSFEAEIARAGDSSLNYVSPARTICRGASAGLSRPTTRSTLPSRGTAGSGSRRHPAPPIRATGGCASMNPAC